MKEQEEGVAEPVWRVLPHVTVLGMDLRRAELKVYKKGVERWDVTV